MFGSVILDVLIGLFLVYIVLSIMASAVNEFLMNITNRRAKDLAGFVQEFFQSPGNQAASQHMVRKFYDSVIVDPTKTKAKLPSYIPNADFVQGVLEAITFTVNADASLGALRSATQQLPADSPVRSVLTTALDKTDGTLQSVGRYLEGWFDRQMQHVSNTYKRRTNLTLVTLGLVLAAVMNIDTIRIANALLESPTLRATIVQQAEALTTQGQAAAQTQGFIALQDQLTALQIPMSWPDPTHPCVAAQIATDSGTPNAALDASCNDGQTVFGWWLQKLLGLAITGFAVSQGAPFWFDLLNKITNLRASNRPPEATWQAPAAPPMTPQAAAVAPAIASVAAAAMAGPTPTSISGSVYPGVQANLPPPPVVNPAPVAPIFPSGDPIPFDVPDDAVG
jgi:hypothetical protein